MAAFKPRLERLGSMPHLTTRGANVGPVLWVIANEVTVLSSVIVGSRLCPFVNK